MKRYLYSCVRLHRSRPGSITRYVETASGAGKSIRFSLRSLHISGL